MREDFDKKLELLNKRYMELSGNVKSNMEMVSDSLAKEMEAAILGLYRLYRDELLLEVKKRSNDIARQLYIEDKRKEMLVPNDEYRRRKIFFWKWKPNEAAVLASRQVAQEVEQVFAEQRSELERIEEFFESLSLLENEQDSQEISEGSDINEENENEASMSEVGASENAEIEVSEDPEEMVGSDPKEESCIREECSGEFEEEWTDDEGREVIA